MKRMAGFTLIEVLVALSIAGIVIVAAGRIFTSVIDATAAVSTAREELDRVSNAHRWLKATFLSLEPPFEGRPNKLVFNSMQLNPGGWFELQATQLGQEGGHLLARSGPRLFALADSVTDVTFDYLLEPGAATRWVHEWVSPVSAPLAVRVRVGGCGRRDAGCVDTLLFLIRERG